MISLLKVEVKQDSVVIPYEGVDYYTKSVNSKTVSLFGIVLYRKNYAGNMKLKVLKDSVSNKVGFIKK